jgi:hypothetical protein
MAEGTASTRKATAADKDAADEKTQAQAGGAADAPAGAQGKASAGTKRYRTVVALGTLKRGEEFEAGPDDPRVKSPWVYPVEDAEAPDEVQAALDQA